MRQRACVVAISLCAVVMLCFTQSGFARERSRSGSYQGKRSKGTFQQNTSRSKGKAAKGTTWQSEKGQGTRQSQKAWDKETGTGTYSSSTTGPDGKSASRSGTVVRNEDGTYSAKGQVTGPKGNVAEVDKTITKNEDGTRSVQTSYTGSQGKTATVNKTSQKTEAGREVTGTYSTGAGKSGSFQSSSTVSDGSIVKSQSLTNQDDKVVQRSVETSVEGHTATRNVEMVGPEGETNSNTQSVTLDSQSPTAEQGQ